MSLHWNTPANEVRHGEPSEGIRSYRHKLEARESIEIYLREDLWKVQKVRTDRQKTGVAHQRSFEVLKSARGKVSPHPNSGSM
jgi:hypothetical protein